MEKCRRGNLTRILEMESTDKEISELKPSESNLVAFVVEKMERMWYNV